MRLLCILSLFFLEFLILTTVDGISRQNSHREELEENIDLYDGSELFGDYESGGRFGAGRRGGKKPFRKPGKGTKVRKPPPSARIPPSVKPPPSIKPSPSVKPPPSIKPSPSVKPPPSSEPPRSVRQSPPFEPSTSSEMPPTIGQPPSTSQDILSHDKSRVYSVQVVSGLHVTDPFSAVLSNEINKTQTVTITDIETEPIATTETQPIGVSSTEPQKLQIPNSESEPLSILSEQHSFYDSDNTNTYGLVETCYSEKLMEYPDAHVVINVGGGKSFYCLHLIIQPKAKLGINSFEKAEDYCVHNYNGHLLSIRNIREGRFLIESYLSHYFQDTLVTLILGVKGLIATETRFTDGTPAYFLTKELNETYNNQMFSVFNSCYVIEYYPIKDAVPQRRFARTSCAPNLFDVFACKEPIPDPGPIKPFSYYQRSGKRRQKNFADHLEDSFKSLWVYIIYIVLFLSLLWMCILCYINFEPQEERKHSGQEKLEECQLRVPTKPVPRVRFDAAIQEMQTKMINRQQEFEKKTGNNGDKDKSKRSSRISQSSSGIEYLDFEAQS